jgi:bacterioferritin-associated ferredoxin
MIICSCNLVRLKDLNQEIQSQPQADVETVIKKCGAGTECGSCVDRIRELMNSTQQSAQTNNSANRPAR